MKKKKILKYTMALALVFGIGSSLVGCKCNKDDEKIKSEQEKIYDLYVAYMSAKGETPDSYEVWLETIKGDKGDKGEKGDDGLPGKDGATWYSGDEIPVASIGKEGDLYLQTSTNNIYVKTSTGWVVSSNIKGEDGDAGKDGATWYSGDDVPSNELGKVNDLYFHTITGNVYAKKSQGWELVSNVKGDDGENGKSILSGEGVPESTLGVLSDLYLDKLNYNLYEKVSSGWILVGSFKGEDGKDGASISGVDVSYEIDNDGNEYMIYTFSYDGNREPEVIKILIPSKVTYIGYDGDYYIDVCNDGEVRKLRLYVEYENGTHKYIDVEDYMYVVDENEGYDKIDFSTLGEYYFKIKYQGVTTTGSVKIVDPLDTSISYITLEENNFIVKTDGSELNIDFSNIVLNVFLKNGDNYLISLDKAIEEGAIVTPPEAFTVGEFSQLEIDYFNCVTYLNVLPLNDFSDVMVHNGSYIGEEEIYIKLNDIPFTQGEFIKYYAEYEGGFFYYYEPVTMDMLFEFDNSKESSSYYFFDSSKTYNVNVDGGVIIFVYDEENLVVNGIYSNEQLKVNFGKYEDINIQVMYSTEEVLFTKSVPLDESMIVEGSVDFTKKGKYDLIVKYEGIEENIVVDIYDPQICNIKDIDFYEASFVDYYLGMSKEELLDVLDGKKIIVEYYEEVNGHFYEEIVLTKDMINLDNFNPVDIGVGTINVSYGLEGQEKFNASFEISVLKDFSGATMLGRYEINNHYLIESIEIYDNGYAVVNDYNQIKYVMKDNYLEYKEEDLDYYNYIFIDNQNSVATCIPLGSIKASYTTSHYIYGELINVSINIYSDESYMGNGKYYATLIAEDYQLNLGIIEVNIDANSNVIEALGDTYIIDGTNLIRNID